MVDQIQEPDGATLLDPDEIDGLLLDHLQTRGELNKWEYLNIQKAIGWVSARRHRDLLSQNFICKLHRQMFGDVWAWAGQFRKTEKNLGCDPVYIAVRVHELCADCQFWIENGTYPADEIAVRFHHQLVLIHPFSNGNGRHGRLLTDLLVEQVLNEPVFSWGNTNFDNSDEGRVEYIKALRAADKQNIEPLLSFVRS